MSYHRPVVPGPASTASVPIRSHQRPLRVLTGALVALLTAAAVLLPTPTPAVAETRPNIILVTADDMAKTDLRWMPQTRRLLQAAGVEVSDFLSNHPLCCPARAEILTGQYAQNNGVMSNTGPNGGYGGLSEPGNHVGAWLESSGYNTAMVGKHMNGWGEKHGRQPGWTVFDPMLRRVYSAYDITMYNDGNPRLYQNIHSSDLIGKLSVKYIRRFAASEAPFFLWTSQVAPHNMFVDGRWVNPIPAERHRDLYPNAVPPSLTDPAFNEDDVSDKPAWVQDLAKVSTQAMVNRHRARIRTLRSVDDQVAAMVDVLEDTGELDNTYIFFTSDNGFLLGEHRLRSKNLPYEQSLRVPLLVRGPGLTPGTTRARTYSLVDLAPTFVNLAGATPGRTLDGRSMLGSLLRGAPGYSHYLVQAGHDEGWWWRGVRSKRYVYLRYDDGFEELYDMRDDPAQLLNVAGDAGYAAVKADYAARLSVLEDCSGRTCRTGGSATP
jgi:N-acetylglucosamine-6-sulfatase